MSSETRRVRVGLLGYGALGVYLADHILTDPRLNTLFELVFVWNRTMERVTAAIASGALPAVACADLRTAHETRPDLVVEVCHPQVAQEWGPHFLQFCAFFCGSPTAFADDAAERALRDASSRSGHAVYVPAGALWGGPDIAKMADRDALASVCVTMKKHPDALRLEGELAAHTHTRTHTHTDADGEWVVYDGPVRPLCKLAPNNVNTMACACIAAHTLGFDGVRARLIAHTHTHAHTVIVEVVGRRPTTTSPDAPVFRVVSERLNPASPGAVTGSATYASFAESLRAARGKGAGVHLV